MSLPPIIDNSSELSDDKTLIIANPPKSSTNGFKDLVRFVLLALVIVLPIRIFIAQPFIVSGASMEETFHGGDYLIVDQLSYRLREPTRGDVIVFHYPNDPSKFFIKRIIGLPGERIDINNQTVTVYNSTHTEGQILTEDYINTMNKPNNIDVTLTSDEYFVMGDNRDHSSDSRAWGPLEKKFITGRALVRLFPPKNFDYLPGAVSAVDMLTQKL